MYSQSLFLSTTSEYYLGAYYKNDEMVLRWSLPQPVNGKYVSLANYAVRSNITERPIRVCCNLIHDNWKNPDGCLGDIYHGHGLYSDDRWQMEAREFRIIELK